MFDWPMWIYWIMFVVFLMFFVLNGITMNIESPMSNGMEGVATFFWFLLLIFPVYSIHYNYWGGGAEKIALMKTFDYCTSEKSYCYDYLKKDRNDMVKVFDVNDSLWVKIHVTSLGKVLSINDIFPLPKDKHTLDQKTRDQLRKKYNY